MRDVSLLAPLPLALAAATWLFPGLQPGSERPAGPDSLSRPTPPPAHGARVGPWMEPGAHGEEIPYFARKYGVECAQCHVLPAKLNAYGERFLAEGYRIPGAEPRPTVPLAVWASTRWESGTDGPDAPIHVNRIELISGGELGLSWLSYFLEWRALSLESREDGSLRDRSGRFEDLFLVAQPSGWEILAGQFRQVQQVDVSRRLSLSEPLVLSASLPGSGGDTPRARSLRGFSPSGRSPALRVARIQPIGESWEWTAAVAVPVPGELSLPLTAEAREEASNELALDPKGIFLESFARRGLASVGAHLFYDSPERYLVHAVATASAGPLHWEGMAGAAKTAGSLRARWSVQGDWFPHRLAGIGGRLEDRAGDGAGVAFLPYLNVHFPGRSYTVRLTLQQRLQPGRSATAVEVGTLF